jgi:hypothetical protein
MAIIISDKKLNQKTGTELFWTYNPMFDGPLTVYERNPNFIVTDTATSKEIIHEEPNGAVVDQKSASSSK